jgi:hypothetical protein
MTWLEQRGAVAFAFMAAVALIALSVAAREGSGSV